MDRLWLSSSSEQDGTAQIGLVSVADGSLRVLKSTGWRFPNSIAFSPDGRYLAFDFPLDESVAADIFIAAVDGSSERTVVGHPSDGDFRGRFGLFQIDLPGGRTELIVRGEQRRSLAAPKLSRDGKTLFYIRNVFSSGSGSRSFVAREPRHRKRARNRAWEGVGRRAAGGTGT